MTITPSDLQREAKIAQARGAVVQAANYRDLAATNLAKALKELADLLGMEVCGEALVEKK